ncbi:MAG: DEAD/DEAH box helicase, partial [Dehalococcoidia bacterium]
MPVPDRCPSCAAPWTPAAARCAECGAFPDDDFAPPPPSEDGVPAAETPRPKPAPPRAQPALAPRPAPAPPGASPPSRIPPPPRPEFPRDLDGYRARLQETFGYPEFRDGQSRVLGALGEGDVLAVMPTGSGKSLCYVLPALAVGRTLVVSPLIALMQDQVESLQAAGIAATFINSNLDRAEQNRRYAEFVAGRI